MKTQSNKTTKSQKPNSQTLEVIDYAKNYTPQGEHPEDRIFKDKAFINELSSVQNSYFEKLSSDLNLNEKGETFLFDYVYNDDGNLSFEEWLDTYSLTYQDCIK